MGYDIEKEKREAIEAGQRALSSLRTAKENLNSAKNWGLVDMFGGGFFSTMLKHSKMDQARQNMEQAKYDLRNFSRELNDVNMACNLNINTGDFLSFADYFFDGFVVDWMVQDRINNARHRKPERLLVAENQYKEFKKSGKKPSDFCKENLRMSDVKSYDYVFNYFSNSGILVEAIKEYHRTAKIPKGEYTLLDLLK